MAGVDCWRADGSRRTEQYGVAVELSRVHARPGPQRRRGGLLFEPDSLFRHCTHRTRHTTWPQSRPPDLVQLWIGVRSFKDLAFQRSNVCLSRSSACAVSWLTPPPPFALDSLRGMHVRKRRTGCGRRPWRCTTSSCRGRRTTPSMCPRPSAATSKSISRIPRARRSIVLKPLRGAYRGVASPPLALG